VPSSDHSVLQRLRFPFVPLSIRPTYII
jgi:hypothetical protein